MRYPRLEALRGYLTGLGLDVTDEILNGIVEIVENEPSLVFEAGDIVEIYEGMGEASFARVLRRTKENKYRVRPYDYEGKWAKHERTVSLDPDQLSSLEQADEYFDIRRGKKK